MYLPNFERARAPLALVIGLLISGAQPTLAWSQEHNEDPNQDPAAEATAERAVDSSTTAPAEPSPTPAPFATPPAAAEDTTTETITTGEGSVTVEGDAPPADRAVSKRVEETYITGSRIRRRDLYTPAPVVVITRRDIEASGLKSTGDILQGIAAQNGGINAQANNGGDGSVRVNLRGLGTARTLVLVNGRRFVAGGSGADASVDLNTIPSEIIDRIEVLKDGGSALYGSDAIGGVVNVITRKDFAGVEGSTYLAGTKAGGRAYSLSVTGGQTTQKGSFLLTVQFFDQKPILAGQRDFSKSDLDFDFVERKESTAGSSAIPEGYFRDRGEGDGNAAWQRLLRDNPGANTFTNDPVDGFRPFRPTGNRDVGDGDFYNYQPENYLLTPNQRITVWGQGDYELGSRARAYLEATVTSRRSEQLLAPEPLFTASEGITVSADNIYNPFGRDFVDVRRRLVEVGNRIFDQEINTYRTVVGMDGSYVESGWLSTWKWDANFIYGRTEGTDANRGRLVRHRLASAIGPSFIDASGVPRCGTPAAPIDDCVPLNLFGGPGTITQDQIRPLTYTGVARGFSDQRVVSFQTEGELFELRGRPVGLALGYQFRREEGGYTPDPLTAAGDTTGNKGESTGGGYSENAGFAELQVPLLADLPGVDLIEAQAAIRVFDFDTFGGDATYKLGATWHIVKHFALRSTYSTAFRAPSILDLFLGQSDAFPDAADPCDTSQEPRASETIDKNCRADGLADDFKDDQSQHKARVGGFPGLSPETASIVTAGIVVTPTQVSKWIDGFSLTIDYFSFDVANAIQTKGADVILNNCYSRTEGRSDCDLITRDAQGFIANIVDTNTNIGGNETSGIDFGVNYALPTSYGNWSLLFDAVWLEKYNEIQPTRVVEGKGNYDLGLFAPLRYVLGLSWKKKEILGGATLHYVGPIRECQDKDCSGENRDRHVSSNTTVDLYAGYSFDSPLGGTSIQGGINNIFDQDPSLIYNGFLANSDADAYDFYGRFFYMSVRQEL